jgi:hypothetical protein
MLVGPKSCYTVGEFRPEFSGAQDYFRLSERTQAIHQVPKIL